MTESETNPARGRLFGARGRRRVPASIRTQVPTAEAPNGTVPNGTVPNGVDENLPPGLRLAAAWSWRLLALTAAIAVFIFIVIQLRLIVIPVLVAVLVSALLVPLVGFLVRHRWPRGLAVAAALLGTLAVVAGLITLAVTQIAVGTVGLNDRVAASYQSLKAVLLASPLQLTEPELNAFLQQVWKAVQADSQVFVSGALTVGSSLGHLLTGLLLALFSLLFILIDGRGIWAWVVRIFPQRARAAVDGAGTVGWAALGNFAKVQILVASIDAVGIGVGAALLGVPLAIPIGVLVFLGSFIPIIGAVAAGAVAVVIALIFNGWVVALLMLGVVLLVQQVEGHVLQPLIMGTAVKVHPLGVVLAVAAGSLLAGIAGALFAVPVAAVLNVMITYINSGVWRDVPPTTVPVARSPLWQTVPQRPGFRRTGYRIEKSATHD
ncbi:MULTISPECIES: AI-2E family transporter [Cryobacterium]|uniref:AI-2E family transporter n=1 Tax=Cryobacterium TaxID=69578 RepID=UPI001F53FDC6|nr:MULTISPECIES: AI-2E family transporter [Cryobacterium]